MKKTSNKEYQVSNKQIAIVSVVTIFVIVMLGKAIYNAFISEEDTFVKSTLLLWIIFEIGITVSFVSWISGTILGKAKISLERNKVKQNNPYIYYRELPNKYGIGVATLLMDSVLENEKDIVATILDLCARGYLTLNKDLNETYQINVLKPIDENLLLNEKYVMNAIINNQITKMNYKEWFELCKKDCLNLNLIEPCNNKYEKKEINIGFLSDERREKRVKNLIKIIFFIGLLYSLFTIEFGANGATGVIIAIIHKIFTVGISCIIISFISVFILQLVEGIVGFIAYIGKTGVEEFKQTYKNELLQYLRPTKLGVEETQKLQAFKSFIKDFGYFASRNPEEIVLWEYYLSYAQVFELTEQILATGYKQIVENGSFNIDASNKIKLENIKLSD